ncbi:hypothetical protein GNI_143540 [Gregarina niphandrodes]|uniref:Uncharacterized protein n=1 Tax=Gregarina niphandrodes TaxID=110365 RepID=A0A023B016_GRENI|nr:hypothetical protein GNI_143540 [Gregarina niphandrodes]EZG44801.1 hypothetical protein GNI_143540 [Gregarina niphandrodes]|eukprot:XP_011132660.1 hypothetical protein GNI_143540 [Gregarina niphandrodes]
MVPPNVEAGSFAELEIQARAICGRWLTVVERSDSLDPQMVYVGIGKMKRMVMNRLVIPLGAELVDGGETLKVWIETPVGNKITHASLVGKETFDADGDLGDWTAKSYVTDYAWIKFCNGKEFRALQMQRENPKLGTAFETKAVLPDNEFGKILLYNITIQPPAGSSQSTISVDRVYKYEGPIA